MYADELPDSATALSPEALAAAGIDVLLFAAVVIALGMIAAVQYRASRLR